jgi:hypothetical protein
MLSSDLWRRGIGFCTALHFTDGKRFTEHSMAGEVALI